MILCVNLSICSISGWMGRGGGVRLEELEEEKVAVMMVVVEGLE